MDWFAMIDDEGRLASTLRIKRKPGQEPPAAYAVRLFAKGNQQPAKNDGGMIRPFDDRREDIQWYKLNPNEIDLIRITRQAHATAAIKNVPLRHDLYPEEEPAEATK